MAANPHPLSRFIQRTPDDTDISGVRNFIMDDFSWNVDLLNSVLSNEELDLVQSIPLSKRPVEDKLVWHYDKNGHFTVKRVYHIARNWILPPSLAASSSSPSCPFGGLWDKLWKACIPPKVKMMAWRLISNIVPTTANSNRKHIPVDPHRILCRAENESTRHLLLECPFARAVWISSQWVPASRFRIMNLSWNGRYGCHKV